MNTSAFLTKAFGALLMLHFISASGNSQDKPRLTDEEIAHVAVVANQIDIVYARIAQKKSKDKQVLQFAETMVNDHQAIMDQASDLIKKLGMATKDNAVSQLLLDGSTQTKTMLSSQTSANFDRAYVDNEVAYHRAVISAIEGLLKPEAKNKDLKALLDAVVPALKTHLKHAEMLQNELHKK